MNNSKVEIMIMMMNDSKVGNMTMMMMKDSKVRSSKRKGDNKEEDNTYYRFFCNYQRIQAEVGDPGEATAKHPAQYKAKHSRGLASATLCNFVLCSAFRDEMALLSLESWEPCLYCLLWQ